MGIQFELSIVDRMSGPARDALRDMQRLEHELGATEKAIRDLDRAQRQLRITKLSGTDVTKQQKEQTTAALRQVRIDQLRTSSSRSLIKEQLSGASRVVHEQARAVTEMDRGYRRVEAFQNRMFRKQQAAQAHDLHATKEQERETRHFGDTARSVLTGIVTMAAGATVGITALGVSFLRAAGHMSDLRAITMNFLTTQMGTHEAADQMLRLERFSTRFGVSLEQASTDYHRMVAQGFNTNEAMAILQGGADVSTVMGPEVMEQLSRDLAILKQEGTVDTRHLRALSFAGVGIGDVTGEIALARNQATQAQTGRRGTLTGHNIMEMVKGRQITGEETISAALRVIQQRFSGGPNARLGDRAVRQAATTMGGSINRLSAQWDLFLSHVGDTGAFQPVIRFMDRIGVALGDATTNGTAFNTALKPMLDQLDKVDIASMITRAAQAMPAFIRTATGAVGLLITMVERLDQANAILHGRSVGNLGGENMSDDQRGVGNGMAQAPVDQGGWQSVFNWISHPLESMRIDNERMMREADATGRNAAARVEQGFRDQAQIHSPSKVFTRLGMNMIEGLALGMNLRLDEVENSAQAIMSTMDREIGGATVESVGGQSVSIGDVNVNVDGSDPDAEEIGRQVKRHLASLITEISSSQGMAT